MYEGEWDLTGRKHGKGAMFNKRGIHEGWFRQDKKTGRGRMIYFDGKVYTGEWRDNLWHGEGSIEFSNGSRYEGKLKKHQFDGFGKFTDVDGSSFEGYWSRRKKHGFGEEKDNQGRTIKKGFWQQNKFIPEPMQQQSNGRDRTVR